MRTLSFVFAFFVGFSSLFAQKNDATNLVKTVDPGDATAVVFDFDHKDIELDKWKDRSKTTIRIRLEIHANMPQAVMTQLVKANRYQLIGAVDDQGVYTVTMPNLEKKVSVGGTDLEDKIVVHLTTPNQYYMDGKQLHKGHPSLVARGGAIKKQAVDKAIDEVEIVFVQTTSPNDAAAGAPAGTVRERVKKGSNAKAPRKHSMLDAAMPMSKSAMKAQYGEILIDGVIFEVE